VVVEGALFTTTPTAEDALAAFVASPPYDAVTLCVPTAKVEIMSVAVPLLRIAVPSALAPSLKVTVPLPVEGTTVAVKVIACPKVLGLGDATNVTVVGVFDTVRLTTPDVLCEFELSPL